MEEQKYSRNKIDDVLMTALNKIKTLIDVNTVVGTPYVSPGNEIIIPVSKITLGVIAGGGEYGEADKRNEDGDFAGGMGTCASLNPVGFLVITNSDVRFIKIDCETAGEKLFDAATTILEKITNKAKTKCEN